MRALPLDRLAALHKKQFEQMVKTSGVDITLHFPPDVTADMEEEGHYDDMYGASTWETTHDPGLTRTVRVLWSNDYMSPESIVPGDTSASLASLAVGPNAAHAIVRLPLVSALLRRDRPQGDTIFELAKSVFYQEQRFRIVGIKKTGLLPLGPYILWAGLRKVQSE
jgi:hypothetical protein